MSLAFFTFSLVHSPFSLISDLREGPQRIVLGPLLYLHHLSKEITLSYGLGLLDTPSQVLHHTRYRLCIHYLHLALQKRVSEITLIFSYPPDCFLPQASHSYITTSLPRRGLKPWFFFSTLSVSLGLYLPHLSQICLPHSTFIASMLTQATIITYLGDGNCLWMSPYLHSPRYNPLPPSNRRDVFKI